MIVLIAIGQLAASLPAAGDGREVALVDEIVAAVQREDDLKLTELGVKDLPYFYGYELPSTAANIRGRVPTKFSSSSLADYNDCQATKAKRTALTWIEVDWLCPTEKQSNYLTTAFRFEGGRVVEVRTVPVVRIRVGPARSHSNQ